MCDDDDDDDDESSESSFFMNCGVLEAVLVKKRKLKLLSEKLSLASSSLSSTFSFRHEKSTDIDVVSTHSIIPVVPLSF